jgi:hypothetical protein
MRADMAKVIVERPRKKGCAWHKPKGYRRQLRRYGEDGPPRREGIKACWRGNIKLLNEHLGPLRRYLGSQVGRPWDKVFSEICAHIDRSSAVQDHVRDHVADYVTVHALLIDGVPCDGEGGRHYGKPLHQFGYRPWYVCPRTGLLRQVKAAGGKRQRRPKEEGPPKVVPVGDTLQCRFHNGAWHLVTLKPLPEPHYQRERCTAVDALLKLPVARLTPLEARRHYGAEVYAVARRRLGRRELRQFPIPSRWWGVVPGRRSSSSRGGPFMGQERSRPPRRNTVPACPDRPGHGLRRYRRRRGPRPPRRNTVPGSPE